MLPGQTRCLYKNWPVRSRHVNEKIPHLRRLICLILKSLCAFSPGSRRLSIQCHDLLVEPRERFLFSASARGRERLNIVSANVELGPSYRKPGYVMPKPTIGPLLESREYQEMYSQVWSNEFLGPKALIVLLWRGLSIFSSNPFFPFWGGEGEPVHSFERGY